MMAPFAEWNLYEMGKKYNSSIVVCERQKEEIFVRFNLVLLSNFDWHKRSSA